MNMLETQHSRMAWPGTGGESEREREMVRVEWQALVVVVVVPSLFVVVVVAGPLASCCRRLLEPICQPYGCNVSSRLPLLNAAALHI